MLPHFERERFGHLLAGPRVLRRYGKGCALVNARALLRSSLIVTFLLVLVASGALAETRAVPRILALGDSLTAGFGLLTDQAFPVRLQARLAADGVPAEVVNAGVSGDTTAGGLARLDWALSDRPDIVLVELGANDALRGIDPKLTFANLDKILARLKEAGARVLLIGMRAPANWGKSYQAEFDAIYPKLAEKYQAPLYPFFLDGVAMDASLNQGDGLHPNARGVEVIVQHIEPYVVRLLRGKSAQR